MRESQIVKDFLICKNKWGRNGVNASVIKNIYLMHCKYGERRNKK